MALCGRLAEPMVKILPQIYRQHVIYKKVRPVLYVTLNKLLYVYLRSTLLFYKQLVTYMRGKGFELNLYDPCVSNKMIRGNQMTVFWHVENLKFSHVNLKEVTNFMEWLEGIYGELSTTRDKVHEYLSITLDFGAPGELRVIMVD